MAGIPYLNCCVVPTLLRSGRIVERRSLRGRDLQRRLHVEAPGPNEVRVVIGNPFHHRETMEYTSVAMPRKVTVGCSDGGLPYVMTTHAAWPSMRSVRRC